MLDDCSTVGVIPVQSGRQTRFGGLHMSLNDSERFKGVECPCTKPNDGRMGVAEDVGFELGLGGFLELVVYVDTECF